jgi:ketosteroid isomerase-like protein
MFGRQPFVALLLAGVIMVTLPMHSLGLVTLSAVGESANVAAVWEREEAYWRYAAAGEVQRYRDLWADGFLGWPSDQPHPVTKAGVTDWIEKMRDQKIRMAYTLSQEGAADYGDVVVIYYQVGIRLEHPDGRVEGGGVPLRVTHTWRRVDDVWRIIGGMAAEMPTPTPN